MEFTAGRAPEGDLSEEGLRPNQLYPRVVAQLGFESTGVILSMTTSPMQDGGRSERTGGETHPATFREHDCDNNAVRETRRGLVTHVIMLTHRWVQRLKDRQELCPARFTLLEILLVFAPCITQRQLRVPPKSRRLKPHGSASGAGSVDKEV